MKKTIRVNFLFLLLSIILFLNKTQAQDSIVVWKMEYSYYITAQHNNKKVANEFIDIAKNKGVVLYYTPSKYKLIYNKDLIEIGDVEKNKSYRIKKNTAYEGLILMPDEILNKGNYLYLFSDDYLFIEDKERPTIAENICTKIKVNPKFKNSKISYSLFTTNSYPKIPWCPFAFVSEIEGAFLGIERTEKNIKSEGIKLKEVTEVKVPTDFFNIPKGVEIIEMVPPPKLKI
jgi:hypothetical protein